MQHTSALKGEFVLNTGNKEDANQPKHQITPHQKKSTRNTAHFYSQFVEHPSNIRFTSQESDEQIHLVLRSHMIANLPWIALAGILILVPFLGYPIITSLFPLFQLNITTQIIIISFYYLMVFGYAFTNFSLWYFHTTIVTNQKVVDIDIHGILNKDIVEAPLESILDVGYTQVGLFQSLLNYGDIHLQTETRIQNLEVLKSPHPAKVVKMIGDIMEKEKHSESS